jgi:hypothetical protein
VDHETVDLLLRSALPAAALAYIDYPRRLRAQSQNLRRYQGIVQNDFGLPQGRDGAHGHQIRRSGSGPDNHNFASHEAPCAWQRSLGAPLFDHAPFVDPLFYRLNDPASQLIYVADHIQAFTLMLSQRFAYP